MNKWSTERAEAIRQFIDEYFIPTSWTSQKSFSSAFINKVQISIRNLIIFSKNLLKNFRLGERKIKKPLSRRGNHALITAIQYSF